MHVLSPKSDKKEEKRLIMEYSLSHTPSIFSSIYSHCLASAVGQCLAYVDV